MAQLKTAPKKPSPRLFTVDEYYKMGDAGILTKEDRVQLIEGEIICMPPIGPEHAGDVDYFGNVFPARLQGRAHFRTQGPLRLDDYSEPEPDFMILRLRDDFYRSGHPRPGDVLLLVEVSDSSLAFDRGRKLRLYARFLIAEVWIVDVKGQRIEVFRDFDGEAYRTHLTLVPGDTIAPQAFPDIELNVADILGAVR